MSKSHDTGADYVAFWLESAVDTPIVDIPSIGYDMKSKKIIIHKTSMTSGSDKEDILIYCMKTRSWTRFREALEDADRTNMINYKGTLVYYENDDSHSRLYIYDDTPTASTSQTGDGSKYSFYTKPFDFGTPLQRKKIYKVYVTYRCNQTTNAHIKYYINGDTSTTYQFRTGATNPFGADDGIADDTAMEFDDTTGKWETAVLKPATSSEANNIKSFGLWVFNDSATAVDKDFEINDITIIYRAKSVK